MIFRNLNIVLRIQGVVLNTVGPLISLKLYALMLTPKPLCNVASLAR
jgi:hypothetical protein